MIHRALFTFMLMLTCFCILPASAAPTLAEQMKAFPAAKAGVNRFVIVLADKERGEEDAFKLEIVAGKTLPGDGVNKRNLASSIEQQTLPGWGYIYYRVIGNGNVTSTLMAPPEGTLMVDEFVNGKPLLVNYNSRLPVVIYAPEGYQIRYRIWQAPASSLAAEEG